MNASIDGIPHRTSDGLPPSKMTGRDIMNGTTLHHAPSAHPVRRALAILAAVVLASLAFGVGLPWIIVDAPPQTETLWARQVQTRTYAAMPPLASGARQATVRTAR
jgi:hypothetical protein